MIRLDHFGHVPMYLRLSYMIVSSNCEKYYEGPDLNCSFDMVLHTILGLKESNIQHDPAN